MSSDVLTSHAGDGFLSSEIGNVHESVVEAGENVSDAEDELALAHLGTEGHFWGSGTRLGWHLRVEKEYVR
jgi:hypothetical protein